MSDAGGKFVWYELMTTDAAAAAAFYAAVTGWTATQTGDYTILNAGGRPAAGVIARPGALHAMGLPARWTGYIAVDDVDAFVDRVQAAGGALHHPAEDIPAVGRFAVVADPQGADFVLFKPTPGSAPAPAAAVGWHELHTHDWERAFDFYADLFGWTKGDAIPMGPAGTYQLFAIGGVPAGGMMNLMPPATHPAWSYYIGIDEIHAAVDRIEAAGGTITMGPQEVPGGSWIALGLDAQGGRFAVVQAAAAAG